MTRSTRTPSVPRLLVRLKVRLLINRARSQKFGSFTLVASTVLGLLFGVLWGAAAAGFVSDPDPRVVRTAFVVGASVLTLGWTLLPLATFGSDESLDPARLILLPLRPGPLVRGLLVGALVGPAPACVLLIVTGAVFGYLDETLVVVPAAVLLVLLSVATARTVSTALASRLTSRKGADVAAMVVPVFFLALQGVRFVDLSVIDDRTIDAVDNVLRWFPPGMIGQAVVDAGDGRFGVALLQLLPAALLIPVLLRVWARTLARSLTTVTGQSAAERHAAGEGADLALLDRLPVARPTPWGAVAARELRYLVRSPRHKAKILNTVLFGAGVPLFLALRAGSSLSDSAVLLSTVAGYLVILDANNQFGADGPATWLDVVAGNTTRALLIGKNVATTVLVLPVVVLVGVLLAAVSGGWAFLPGAIVLAQAALASGLAAANVISIRYPIKVPDTRNPWGGAGGGQGCATGAVVFACTVVQAILVLPVALAGVVGIVAGPAWLLLSAPIALGYGALLWWFGLRLAADFGRTHEPERIIAVDPARSG